MSTKIVAIETRSRQITEAKIMHVCDNIQSRRVRLLFLYVPLAHPNEAIGFTTHCRG